MTLTLPARTHLAGALCVGMDPELFYPTRNTLPADIATAKAICTTCPAQADCLILGFDEHHGIWGGTTERQRKMLRAARRG